MSLPTPSRRRRARPPRKVVAGYFLSLDGVAEAPDRFITAWDDETDASGANLIATQDAVILGRRGYDEWASSGRAARFSLLPRSSTPFPVRRDVNRSNASGPARAFGGGLVDFVRDLKGRPGGDIGVHDSISVTRTLLAADIVVASSSRTSFRRVLNVQAATVPGIEVGAHAQLSEQGRNMCAACPQYGQGMSRDRCVAVVALRVPHMALLLPGSAGFRCGRSNHQSMRPLSRRALRDR